MTREDQYNLQCMLTACVQTVESIDSEQDGKCIIPEEKIKFLYDYLQRYPLKETED